MIVTRKFSKNLRELEIFLQGAIMAGVQIPALGLFGLNGKTLIFSSPGAATVTFVTTPAGSQIPLEFKDIKSQIETAVPAVKALMYDRRLVLIEAAVGSGVTITKLGTSNSILGFDSAVADTIGKVIKPGPAVKPYFLQMLPTDDGFVLLTEE